MSVLLKVEGWRIGWNPNAAEFKGLVGTDDWAIELTETELNDFLPVRTASRNNQPVGKRIDGRGENLL